MPQIELVVRRPGQPERRMILGQGVTSLGRAEDNDLVLPDIGVSRRHARILIEDGGAVVEDLGSGNGTFCGGRRVDRHDLKDGDEIVIDPFVLHFRFRGGAPGLLVDHDTLAASADLVPPAQLVVLAGHRLDSSYPLGSTPLTMGRSEGRDVVLYDPAASRNHAHIELRGNRHWFVDDNSANGTFVNGERVREYALGNGDRIRIGATEFRYETIAAGLTGPPPGPTYPQPRPTEPMPPVSVQEPVALNDLPTRQPVPIAAAPPPARRPEPIPVAAVQHAVIDQPTVTRAPPPRRGGLLVTLLQLAAVLLVAFVLVLAIAVVGGAAWWYARTRAPQPAAGVVAVQQVEVPPDKVEDVESMMDEGQLNFREGRYLESAARFYQVLQEVPGHAEAERMGFIACEYIAFDRMRVDVVKATTDDAERKTMRKDALALGEAALAGKARQSDARIALEAALAVMPDDADLTATLGKVRRAAAKEAKTETSVKARERAKALYEKADADLSAGELRDAEAGFEKVLQADPDRTTHYYYDAQDGITEARARMRKLAKPKYAQAETAIAAKDWAAARTLLEETLAIDPYNEDAKKALEEVKSKLAG